MTSHSYVVAADDFNQEWAKTCRDHGWPKPTPVHPRAILDALGGIEPKILRRLATKDFKGKPVLCSF